MKRWTVIPSLETVSMVPISLVFEMANAAPPEKGTRASIMASIKARVLPGNLIVLPLFLGPAGGGCVVIAIRATVIGHLYGLC